MGEEKMRRIITEMIEDGGPIFVYEVNPTTGLKESRMSAKESISKKEAKEAHAELLNYWPKMLSSEEIKELMEKISTLNKKKSQKEQRFRKSMEKSIAGID